MPNGNNPFDLVNDFKDAGFQQKQAEILARFLVNVESQNAATKQDLEASTLALKHDIEIVRAELKRDIEGIKRDMVELNANLTKYIGDKTDNMTSKMMTFTGLTIGFISVLMIILKFWSVT